MVFLYTFNVSGTKFFLSPRNIGVDAPNYFTDLVQRYPKRRYFVLDTCPHVFIYIQRHLKGYNPLNDITVPLDDLKKDATYYRLCSLADVCIAAMKVPKSVFNTEDYDDSTTDFQLSLHSTDEFTKIDGDSSNARSAHSVDPTSKVTWFTISDTVSSGDTDLSGDTDTNVQVKTDTNGEVEQEYKERFYRLRKLLKVN